MLKRELALAVILITALVAESYVIADTVVGYVPTHNGHCPRNQFGHKRECNELEK